MMEPRRPTVTETADDGTMPAENTDIIKQHASKEEQTTNANDRQSQRCGDIENADNHEHKHRVVGFFARHRRVLAHVLLFCLFTAWWVTSLVRHRHDRNWVVPFLIYLAVILRLLFYYVPASLVIKPLRWTWRHTASPVRDLIPSRYRDLAGGAVVVAVMVTGSFASEENADNSRANRAVSLFGLAVILFLFWATSKHRRHVCWRTVSAGLLSQYIIGLFVLRTKVGYDIFSFIAARAGDLLSFAREGVAFLTTAEISSLTFFFFSVIPAIIFFISLVQILYYIGLLQWFVVKVAYFVNWALAVSGAEAVVAAATPFIGQGESAMLVRPFVPHMTKAEIHQIMTCGFATISGSVLIGYIQLGLNAEALVSSCIMSIPASLAISKLRYPETEETLTKGKLVMPHEEDRPQNVLHAFADGTVLAIRVAGTILSALLCIVALVGLINGLLGWWGGYLDIFEPNKLSLQLVFGYLFYPVSFLLGVPRGDDLLKVSKLIAEKIIVVSYKVQPPLGRHKIADTERFRSERVFCVHRSRQRSRLHKPHTSVPAHRDVRDLRVRKPGLLGDADRRARPDRADAYRRHFSPRLFGTGVGRRCNVDFSECCGPCRHNADRQVHFHVYVDWRRGRNRSRTSGRDSNKEGGGMIRLSLLVSCPSVLFLSPVPFTIIDHDQKIGNQVILLLIQLEFISTGTTLRLAAHSIYYGLINKKELCCLSFFTWSLGVLLTCEANKEKNSNRSA